MPVREYISAQENEGCPLCRNAFGHREAIRDDLLRICPQCGGPVKRVYSPPGISSPSRLDDRARQAGFTKLKRIGSGEYEKQY
jgi:hypothetical protein